MSEQTNHNILSGAISFLLVALGSLVMLPWRMGIDDAANYELFLARAKELEDPQTVADERIARDIVL